METVKFTRKQLADFILHHANESLLSKFASLMQSEEIVAYTVSGKPLTQKDYLHEVQKGEKSIANGEGKTTDQLREIVASWQK